MGEKTLGPRFTVYSYSWVGKHFQNWKSAAGIQRQLYPAVIQLSTQLSSFDTSIKSSWQINANNLSTGTQNVWEWKEIYVEHAIFVPNFKGLSREKYYKNFAKNSQSRPAERTRHVFTCNFFQWLLWFYTKNWFSFVTIWKVRRYNVAYRFSAYFCMSL